METTNLDNNLDEVCQTEACSSESSEKSLKCKWLNEKMPIAKQRKIAKIGLASSLALTTITGFVKHRHSKKIHTAAGIALVGFSLWHANLYGKPKK